MNQEDRLSLHREVLKFRKAMRTRFAKELRYSRRLFRAVLIKEIRNVFRLPLGRPRDPIWDAVERLKRKHPHLSYRAVAVRTVPGFDKWNSEMQRAYLLNLRHAMTERRRRGKKRHSRRRPSIKTELKKVTSQNEAPAPQSGREDEDA